MSALRPGTPDPFEDSLRGDTPDYIKPTTIIPSEEVETRRQHAIEIGKRLLENCPPYKLTSVHLAAIMITPMDNLELHGHLPYRKQCQNVQDQMKPLVCLVKRFLLQKHSVPKSYIRTGKRRLGTRWKVAKFLSQPIKTTVSSSDADNSSIWTGHGSTIAPRTVPTPDTSRVLSVDSGRARDGELEKELCRQRDHNRCVFTQTTEDVVVTRIIPQAWNDTKENMELTRKVIHAARLFLDEYTYYNYETLFADLHNLGTTDKCWNMISLDRNLQWYLEHRYLGLKCLSIDPWGEDGTESTITIQLNWLYRNKNKPKEVALEGDGNDFDKLVNKMRDFEDQRRIEPRQETLATTKSGQLAHIKMSNDDAKKCKVMLDVAWALSVVAGISGAAEWPKTLPDYDSWFPIQQRVAFDCWVEDQVRLCMDAMQADERYLHQHIPSEQAPHSADPVSETDEQDESINWGCSCCQ